MKILLCVIWYNTNCLKQFLINSSTSYKHNVTLIPNRELRLQLSKRFMRASKVMTAFTLNDLESVILTLFTGPWVIFTILGFTKIQSLSDI